MEHFECHRFPSVLDGTCTSKFVQWRNHSDGCSKRRGTANSTDCTPGNGASHDGTEGQVSPQCLETLLSSMSSDWGWRSIASHRASDLHR
jgi:hypothetical protein